MPQCLIASDATVWNNTIVFDIALIPKFRSAHATIPWMGWRCSVVREGLAQESFTATTTSERGWIPYPPPHRPNKP